MSEKPIDGNDHELTAAYLYGRADANEIIRKQQQEIKRLQAEVEEGDRELDGQWNLLCRLLTALGIAPVSWDETTPEQIERAIAKAQAAAEAAGGEA